jgi:hypothetical protein
LDPIYSVLPTLLEGADRLLPRLDVTDSLNELAVPYLRFEEDAMHDIAIVIADRNERHIFLTSPFRGPENRVPSSDGMYGKPLNTGARST